MLAWSGGEPWPIVLSLIATILVTLVSVYRLAPLGWSVLLELWMDDRGRLRTPADEAFERYELIRARDALISRLRRLVQAKGHAQRSRGPRRRARPGLEATAAARNTHREHRDLGLPPERAPR